MARITLGFAFASLLACGAGAAEITVYKQQNFGGEQLPVRDVHYDLSRVNFHDQISSIVVHSGAWEVCTQPNFRGECVVLKPGRYPALEARINHRIESMREAPLHVLDRAAGQSGHIMIAPSGETVDSLATSVGTRAVPAR
jgi:hypothetical protein